MLILLVTMCFRASLQYKVNTSLSYFPSQTCSERLEPPRERLDSLANVLLNEKIMQGDNFTAGQWELHLNLTVGTRAIKVHS